MLNWKQMILPALAVAVAGVCEVRAGTEVVPSDLREKALRAMGGAEEIVFAVRDLCSPVQPNVTFGPWSDEPNFAHAPDGSRLCKLNLRTRQVTVLLDDPNGGVRDPRVHYDGKEILFSYRKGGTHTYHLCEIRTDGTGFRQLTSGDWDDMDPAYLPDGGIVFASSRGKRFVPCQQFRASLLYRMDADGGNMLCLSANLVADDRPAVMPDGRVIYTRWEYVDRHPQKFRDLWVMNADGSGQALFFGPTRPEGNYFAKCDALPIPGTDKVVTVFSPALGHRENAGTVMVVGPKAGPDDWFAAKQISPHVDLVWSWRLGHGREGFRDPYPLSEDCFLVARDKSLLILGGNGETQEVYRAEKMVHDPRVICPRPREPLIPSRIDLQKTTGQLVLADVYHGRNMKGVKSGDIKSLLVMEDLPKPVSYVNDGLRGAVSLDYTLSLHRILGAVPVEADGSASFEVPPLRGLFFVALDEKGFAVKRMQSYTMVMPGETQGCVGCHETRTGTVSPVGNGVLMALRRPPSRIEPVPGVPEVIDYPRDVQPVLNRHCVTCHSAEKPSGRVVLTGDQTEWYSQSYVALCAYGQISVGLRGADGNNPPWGIGTAVSPLMKKIDGGHHGVKVTRLERDTVRLWIEASAAYTGTYAVYNRRENAVAGFSNEAGPSLGALGRPVGPIIGNRCLICHHGTVDQKVNTSPKNQQVRLAKHYQSLYNLSCPEKSMILLAPLSKEAGGYGWCKAKEGGASAVFRNTDDADYQTLLQAVRAAKARQERTGRIDTPGTRPNEHYVYWMKRFGVLPETFDLAKDPIDVYATDQAYWRSLWHVPPVEMNKPLAAVGVRK